MTTDPLGIEHSPLRQQRPPRNDISDFPIVLPLTKLREIERSGPTIICEGRGIWYVDSHGHELIDALSSGWSLALGHGRRDLADAAFRQMQRLAFSSSMYGYSHEPGIALARKLLEIAPSSLHRVHFTCGGSDANDTAVKLVFLYNNLLGRPSRKNIIAIEGAYHGLTLTSAGLTGLKDCHQNFDLPLQFQHHIPGYHPLRSPWGRGDADIIAGTIGALKEKLRDLGEETVAAVIVEPFKQTGGAILPPQGWLTAVERFCRDHDVLLIVDEVISGFGRTGRMFACEHEGVRPDMMSVAKGLTSGYAPLGALMISEEIFQVIAHRAHKHAFFAHGFTAGGHPVATTVALRAIEAYEKEGVIENAEMMGKHLKTRLREFEGMPGVGNTRGVGMVGAIDLIENSETLAPCPLEWDLFNRIRTAAYGVGITLRAYEGTTVTLAPPLIASREEIDLIIDRTHATLEKVFAELRDQGIHLSG